MIITRSFLKTTPPLTEGGEGIIFEKDDGLIKIYKPHINKNEKNVKVKTLLTTSLPKQVIKPMEMCYDENNNFIGFFMNKVINGIELKQLSNKKTIKSLNITIKDILKVLIQIKDVLKILHQMGIYVGDLNDCNILFDKHFNVYFIDCDSWSIGGINCDVCMDSFKDPLLISDNFNDKTDNYAFAIMNFKSLTKIHPFGGTTTPDLNLLQRMEQKISVIDNNNNVIIPRTISNWNFIPPKLLQQMKQIFENGKRELLDNNLDDYYNNLIICKKDSEYYYSKFTTCPYCDDSAKILDKPVKIDTTAGPKPILYFTDEDIQFILSMDSYVTKDGYVVHNIPNGRRVINTFGSKVYFVNKDCYIEDKGTELIINYNNSVNTLKKKYKTDVVVENGFIYFISNSDQLTRVQPLPGGNSIENISKCSSNAIFDYSNGGYFICNNYQHTKLIEIDKYFYQADGMNNNTDKIVNYGIHKDSVTGYWLFIYETDKGVFKTFVFNKNELKFSNDLIKYTCSLKDICFSNATIFAPNDGYIKGFSYQKNAYKNFECSVVTTDSKLIRDKNKFFIINNKSIYSYG